MNEITYLGHVLVPYGNVIGKDAETRWYRLLWRTDTLSPLLSKADGYDYEGFTKAAGAAADIYFYPQNGCYYVPAGGGLCRINEKEIRKYIKILEGR